MWDKFARWGDNYQYHIGDFSAATCGHAEDKITKKYKEWSNVIFEQPPANHPRLRKDIFFWAKAWNRNNIGIWEEFGPMRLTFLEYLLIGVARNTFEKELLDEEGVNI